MTDEGNIQALIVINDSDFPTDFAEGLTDLHVIGFLILDCSILNKTTAGMTVLPL
jgi:hypothetical protein